MKHTVFLILATCASMACSSAITATERAQPDFTLQSAKTHQAYESETSRDLIASAEKHLANADRLIKKGDYDMARLILARAEADADLALEYAMLNTEQQRYLFIQNELKDFRDIIQANKETN